MAPSPAGTAACIASPRRRRSRAASASDKRTGGGERRIFAERMARDQRSVGDLHAFALERAHRGEADGHQRRLCVGGELQRLFRAFEDDLRQLFAERGVDFGEDGARDGIGVVQGTAHAYGLAALSGEGKRDCHGSRGRSSSTYRCVREPAKTTRASDPSSPLRRESDRAHQFPLDFAAGRLLCAPLPRWPGAERWRARARKGAHEAFDCRPPVSLLAKVGRLSRLRRGFAPTGRAPRWRATERGGHGPIRMCFPDPAGRVRTRLSMNSSNSTPPS